MNKRNRMRIKKNKRTKIRERKTFIWEITMPDENTKFKHFIYRRRLLSTSKLTKK